VECKYDNMWVGGVLMWVLGLSGLGCEKILGGGGGNGSFREDSYYG
jgi:hypothetical protein